MPTRKFEITDYLRTDRQIAAFKQTGDMKSVVDHLVRETAEGVV